MRLKNLSWTLTAAFMVGTLMQPALAASAASEQPKLVIIIDNLGDQEQTGAKVANLPGQVACSILPHGRFSAKIAELCHAQNKTIILNTPMQAKNNYPLGLGGLYANMSKEEFTKTLTDDMASVPYIQGLDNHMGSLLTGQDQPMSWLMETIKPHGLFFLDNKTSPHSVAERLAHNNQVPVIGRDVFLDDVRTPEAVHKQFNEALKIAKRYGIAVIVAHPYAVTLNYLQANLPNLAAQGYQLASIPQALNVSIQPVTLAAVKPTVEPNNIKINKIVAPVEKKIVAEQSIPEKVITEKTKPVPVVVKPIAASPTKTVVAQTMPAEKTPASKIAAKPSAPAATIEVPTITGSASQSAIELTVNKDRQVVVNTVDQTTKPATSETIALNLPVDKNAVATTNDKTHEPGLISRLSEKFTKFFHEDHSDNAKPAAAQTQTAVLAAEQAITQPPIKNKSAATNKHQEKKVSAKQEISGEKKVATIQLAATTPKKADAAKPIVVTSPATATQETAKASQSLMQTFKDDLCKKYKHFCGHAEHASASEQPEFTNVAFIDEAGKLHWPTAGNIATHFGTELGDSKLKYNGVLIQAPSGQPVHAIYKGRVIFANWLQGLGLLLIIDHGNGYMSLYGHNEALYKKVGDTVKPNDLIAAVGNSGTPGPAGLYFEIRHNGQPINPENWCG